MPASSDSVKVAVRVRPFNQRELNAGSKCVISMKGNSTTITNPETGDVKTFAFDHSYWSHDGSIEDENGVSVASSSTSNYADQRMAFSDLGQGVLDNAWQGYNAALFAYGQTGSGKSYSMIGYGANKGIVPITCEELFKGIDENADKTKKFQVTFSMLEIYNEQVRDLLVKAKPQTGGLKIRQNPNTGFYVEGLKQVPVRNYKEIERLMEQGTINRTTASTNMNATSSRSHMVITIRFEQVFLNEVGQSNTRSSDINLVDLAGSERADATGATGDRLKEGSAINQSLSTLGNVISALADVAMGKKKVIVPYRDSVLTKLLQSALGGNSRTIMIAALSPADINYDETLSTLRYADRAKKIQNRATVNESPTDRLIRELKEENAKLMAMLKKQQGGKGGVDTEELTNMLEENQRKMNEMNLSWEQRLEQARHEWEQQFLTQSETTEHEWKQLPFITNINEDPQLSNVIKHSFNKGKTVIGKAGTDDILVQIRGLGILQKHAIIYNDGQQIELEPFSKNAQVIVNGIKVKEKTVIQHLDRIKLGSSSLFLYVGFPYERGNDDQLQKYNFDYFMMELAEHEGTLSAEMHTPRSAELGPDMSALLVFQEYMDLMPKVAEANAISEELKKDVHFDAEVKSLSSHDPTGKAPGKEIIVYVSNLKTKKVWLWTKDKFLYRKDLMDEIYTRFLDGENVTRSIHRDKDPFWDPVEDIFLGSCHVWLQGLAYCMEVDEHFTLHNYHGKEEAVVQVRILPCDPRGKVLENDEGLVGDPRDLLKKPLHFLLMLPQCMGVKWVMDDHTRGIYCKFSFYGEPSVSTKTIWGKTYAELNLKKQLSFSKVTEDLINYLQTQSLVLELWGTQVSEDKELHKSMPKNGLHKLVVNEEKEVEELSQENETLKKSNFELKKSLDKSKQAIQLAKVGRDSTSTQKGSFSERKPSATSERRSSVTLGGAAAAEGSNVGLDVDLAKALRIFFKDVKSVQEQLKMMQEYAGNVQRDPKANGNIKAALEKHEEALKVADSSLTDCVHSLKQSVASTIRKAKPH